MRINVAEELLYILLFVDNQVFIANYEEDIEYMTRKLMENYLKWGFNINITETERRVVGGPLLNIQIEDEVIKGYKDCK